MTTKSTYYKKLQHPLFGVLILRFKNYDSEITTKSTNYKRLQHPLFGVLSFFVFKNYDNEMTTKSTNDLRQKLTTASTFWRSRSSSSRLKSNIFLKYKKSLIKNWVGCYTLSVFIFIFLYFTTLYC